jgi:superfamily II DNA/RNA helicase
VFSLLHAAPQDSQTENLVHVCISNKPGGLDGVTSPIIIGTPKKLLSALRASGLDTLDELRVSYCVVDEVDRCLAVKGRYSPDVDGVNDAVREENPTGLLISALAKTQPADGGMQLVASSATVGRPLRRELFRLLHGGKGYGELTVIRPEVDIDGKESKGPQVGSTRQVTIPKSIRHVAFMCEREQAPTMDSLDDSDLNVKLSIAKDLWIKSDTRKACLFVPTAEVTCVKTVL